MKVLDSNIFVHIKIISNITCTYNFNKKWSELNITLQIICNLMYITFIFPMFTMAVLLVIPVVVLEAVFSVRELGFLTVAEA